MRPRYPEVRVELSTCNPLVWVSAVRHGLWKNGVSKDEIRRFSAIAFERMEPERVLEVCGSWARVLRAA